MSKPVPWPSLVAGEEVTIRIPGVSDADTEEGLDLEAATAIEWQLRRCPRKPGQDDDDEDNPVIVAKDLDDGITVDGADILVELEAADTGELAGTYWADCWVTIAGKRRLAKEPAPLEIGKAVNAP